MNLYDQDIYVNVAGGIKVNEPAVDLGMVTSIASSFLNRPVEEKTAIFGEVGLTGEIRATAQSEQRIMESGRMGFQRCILPRFNLERIKSRQGMDLMGVGSVEEVIRVLF